MDKKLDEKLNERLNEKSDQQLEAQEKPKKSGRRWILFAVSLIVLLAGAVYLFIYFTKIRGQQKQNHNVYEDLQKKEEVVAPPKEPEKEPVVIPIDFTALKQTNPDIYAWIDINDTNVHYPIAQSATDNLYYLEHTIEGKKGLPGSIYTENGNSKEFTDFNTLIYGHDMKNGTMFKHLHKFKNAEFFNTHETVTIYTETEIKTYRIYAVVEYDDRHILNTFDQSTPEGRLEFIQSLSNFNSWNNHFREGMTITENDKLITLSTCMTGQPNKRLIVVAAQVANS